MSNSIDVQANATSLSPAERRRAPRAALNVEIGFLSATNFYTGFAEDISEGGLFVATHMLREVGSEIALNFTLPNGHEVNAIGVVRWLRDPHQYDAEAVPGMGVQFRDLSAADCAVIREFITLREPMFFDA